MTKKKKSVRARIKEKFKSGASVVNGTIMPQGKPINMSLENYFKSCLAIVEPSTGLSMGDAILAAQSEKAVAGDTQAATFIFDRAFGKPREAPKERLQGTDVRVIVTVPQPKRKVDES